MSLESNGFDTVSSNGALSLNFAQVSMVLWFMQTATVHNEIFCAGPTPTEVRPGIIINAGVDISFWYDWSGGAAVWFMGAVSNNIWYGFGVAYDRGADTNDPYGRLNFASPFVGEVLTPSGAALTPAAGYRISGFNNFAGRVAHIQVFDRLLSTQEMDASLLRPGSIRNGLRLWRPCWDANSTEDLSGAGGHGTTNTNLGTGPGPPCSALRGSRTGRQIAAVIAASGEPPRTMAHMRRRRG